MPVPWSTRLWANSIQQPHETVGRFSYPQFSVTKQRSASEATRYHQSIMNPNALNLSPKVIEHLGHYVYLYVDPRDQTIFYVGKGSGSRCLHHLSEKGENDKLMKIASIRGDGLEPRIDILVHGLPSAGAALQLEAAVIDLIGRDLLTNRVGGWRSEAFGRMDLKQIVSLYDPKQIDITEPALLIRISQKFHYGMRPVELYDATRGIWRIGPDRGKAQLAFSVFQGVVREVYQIATWLPAGSTFYTRDEDLKDPERWEFVGAVAGDSVRRKYLDGSVAHYFPPNAQTPFIYVNIKQP